MSVWKNTLFVLGFAPCCSEGEVSAEEAGAETGCLSGSYSARWTPGPSYRGTEALFLKTPRTSLAEPCAAPSSSEEHRAPGRRGSMDTVEPGTQGR